MKTISSAVAYMVEFYPFQTLHPTSTVNDAQAFVLPTAIVASQSNIQPVQNFLDNIFSNKDKSFSISQKAKALYRGITGINISRSKGSPNGSANIAFVGPMPPDVVIGVWCVISTITNKRQKTRALTRFVGQIESINTEYMVDDSTGLVSTRSSVSITEWSKILTATIAWNSYSNVGSALTAVAGQSNAALNTLAGYYAEGMDESLRGILLKSYSPFEFGELVLGLVGAITKEEYTIPPEDQSALKKYNQLNCLPPAIPRALQARLAVDGSQNVFGAISGAITDPLGEIINQFSPQSAYSSGFVKFISGVIRERKQELVDDKWDGVFGAKEDASTNPLEDLGLGAFFGGLPSINAFRSMMRSGREQAAYTVINGYSVLTGLTMTAWSLLNSRMESTIFECFTDMYYQDNGSDGVDSQPVIIIRDKPFLLGKFKNDSIETVDVKPPVDTNKVDLDRWSVYDFVPRIKIDSEAIVGMQVVNTAATSHFYVNARTNPTRGSQNGNTVEGLLRASPEIIRYGSQSQLVVELQTSRATHESSSLGSGVLSTSLPPPVWSLEATNVLRFWHSYSYRMADMELRLKDNGEALCLGMNLEFEVGKWTLVGQIESISMSMAVSGNGSEQTMTVVKLSRVVQKLKETDANGHDLDFLPLNAWHSLFR